MIKGCSRRMIVLKDTGSDFFEEAYFVLKAGPDRNLIRSEKDFVAEARRIISANSPKSSLSHATPAGKHPKSGKLISFLLGSVSGAALMWSMSVLL